MYGGAGVLLPLWQYLWVLRSAWFLAIAAICTAQCLVLAVALALARRGRYQQSITLACIGNWAAVLLITFVAPNLLPVMVLAALVPVVFAQPYIRWQRGLVFAVITAGCVLALAAVARFQHFAHFAAQPPRWIEHAFIVIALPMHAFHLLVIAWNNAGGAGACRSRCSPSAPPKSRRHAAGLSRPPTRNGAASNATCMTVPNNTSSRWRCSSNSPATLNTANISRCSPRHPDCWKTRSPRSAGSRTASTLRRWSAGVLPQALSAVAAHAPIPIQLDLQDLGRYPASIEAALYFCCSEALQNAVKHGGPGTAVTITAHADGQTLTLTISDTGRGFEPATTGTGLTNMTDRVSAVGGKLKIDTAPGHGTRITAVVETAAQPNSDPSAKDALSAGLMPARN